MPILTDLQTLKYSENGTNATIQLIAKHSSMMMIKELSVVFDHLEDHSPCTVLIIKGVDGEFNQGLDFSDFHPNQPMDIHGFHKWEKICTRLERLPLVTIALLEGNVIGGGLQMALCCDTRLASPTANLSLPEVKLGFLPGMAVFRLAKYIGLGRAKQWILRAATISAEQAVQWGVVDAISEKPSDLLDTTIDSFQPIQPVTIQLARRLLNESFHDAFEDAIGHFLAAQQRAISHKQFLKTIEEHTK